MEEVDILFATAASEAEIEKDQEEEEDEDQAVAEFLENQNKNKTELIFPQLTGVVNLKNLTQFPKVTTLFFESGTITSIINIPPTIVRINAPDNKIKTVDALPETLEVLNVSRNALKKLELGNVPNLRELNCSYNEISNLGRLPPSLEVLKCEFNNIRELDLKGLTIIKLYCNNNNKLRLYNIPATVMDGNYSNNLINLESESDFPHDYVVMQKDYKKKLDEYFKLKGHYENEVLKANRKVNKKSLETNRLKNPQRAFKKLQDFKTPKAMPPCRGCGKDGGMSFTITSDAYSAQCANNPKCDWKMVIRRAIFSDREKLIYEYLSDIETLKDQFIQSKMDSLFRYYSDLSIKESFQKRMQSYQFCGEQLKKHLDTHNHIYYNEEKKRLLREKEIEISRLLEQVKAKLAEDEADRRTALDDVVRIQDQEIRPIVEYIRNKRYECYHMLYANERNEYTLYTREVLAEKLDSLLSGSMTMSATEKPN